MITATAAAIWLALAAISLACTLSCDGEPLTWRKTVIGLTFGPIAIIVGALVLAAAAIGGRR